MDGSSAKRNKKSTGNKKPLFFNVKQVKDRLRQDDASNDLFNTCVLETEGFTQSTPQKQTEATSKMHSSLSKVNRSLKRKSIPRNGEKIRRAKRFNSSETLDTSKLTESVGISDTILAETIPVSPGMEVSNPLNEISLASENLQAVDTSSETIENIMNENITSFVDSQNDNQETMEKILLNSEKSSLDEFNQRGVTNNRGSSSLSTHLCTDKNCEDVSSSQHPLSDASSQTKNKQSEKSELSVVDFLESSHMIKDNEQLAELNLTEISMTTTAVKSSSYSRNTFYGLPMKVKETLIRNRGISTLYEWQHTCLCLPAVMNRTNMIYSLPTSGGKTLVAEILTMQELLLENRNVLLVLPYVSIVQEKVRDLSPFAVQLGFHIEEYAARKGCLPPKKRRWRRSVYIATIEKANAILNSFVEKQRTSELGKVVVDELHMIGEGGGRGALLEILLSKVMYTCSHVQIIGMSATLGNIDELKTFLNADVFTNEFRPVELTEHVKVDDTLFLVNSTAKTEQELCKPLRRICHPVGFRKAHKSNDADHIASMILEVIPNNSCMVFCPTKKNCENVALMLSSSLPKSHLQHKINEKQSLLNQIKNVSNGICRVLSRTIPCGIAYHHSGLTMDERKLIEDAYAGGVLCLLCCTSTLAAGVNLPAKRVILRSPYVGNSFMSRAQYKQMIGRAGRAGIDTSGESILILQRKDVKKAQTLLRGSLGTCTSSLYYQNGKGLRELALSLLGLKICNSDKQLKQFVSTTLYHQQFGNENHNLLANIKKEIAYLAQLGMLNVQQGKDIVVVDENDSIAEIIQITNLGSATLKGCVDIDMAPTIARELNKCLTCGLVLANQLQLLYLATPIDQLHGLNVNWMLYYNHVGKLNETENRAVEIIGVKESSLMRKATGQTCSRFDDFVYKRFYLTLMLYQLIKMNTVWQVAETFEVSRGFLQNLMSAAGSFASLLLYFTAEIKEYASYKLLFQQLLETLTHTSDIELAPLLDIPGVKQARARQLFKAGYHTLKDLAWLDAKKLSNEIEHLPYKQANLIVSSAKMLLQEKIEALREEADEFAGVATNPAAAAGDDDG